MKCMLCHGDLPYGDGPEHECPSERTASGPSDATACSPSLLAQKITDKIFELGNDGIGQECYRIEFKGKKPNGEERGQGGMCHSALVRFITQILMENDKGLATQPAPQMPEKHK